MRKRRAPRRRRRLPRRRRRAGARRDHAERHRQHHRGGRGVAHPSRDRHGQDADAEPRAAGALADRGHREQPFGEPAIEAVMRDRRAEDEAADEEEDGRAAERRERLLRGATPMTTASAGPTTAVIASGIASVIHHTTTSSTIAARRCASGVSAGIGASHASTKARGPRKSPAVRRRCSKRSSAAVSAPSRGSVTSLRQVLAFGSGSQKLAMKPIDVDGGAHERRGVGELGGGVGARHRRRRAASSRAPPTCRSCGRRRWRRSSRRCRAGASDRRAAGSCPRS